MNVIAVQFPQRLPPTPNGCVVTMWCDGKPSSIVCTQGKVTPMRYEVAQEMAEYWGRQVKA